MQTKLLVPSLCFIAFWLLGSTFESSFGIQKDTRIEKECGPGIGSGPQAPEIEMTPEGPVATTEEPDESASVEKEKDCIEGGFEVDVCPGCPEPDDLPDKPKTKGIITPFESATTQSGSTLNDPESTANNNNGSLLSGQLVDGSSTTEGSQTDDSQSSATKTKGSKDVPKIDTPKDDMKASEGSTDIAQRG